MTVTRDIAVTRQRVWDVLADGWTYSGWVVGNSRIRGVGAEWPAPGARILHSIGTWPAVEARITMQLSDIPGGCRVAMTETAVSATVALGARQHAIDGSGAAQPASARGGWR